VYPSESFSGLSNPRDKFVTRRELLARRDAIAPHVRDAASVRIAARLRVLLSDHGVLGARIALYAPKGSEVATRTIDADVRDAGGCLVYPRVADSTQILDFYQVFPEDLVSGRFGLREPRAIEQTRVSLADIQAYIVPGLGFDRNGWRIGWGRGHYDATLSSVSPNALRVGIAFECQLIDQAPHEPHDAQLQFVVTELATYKASSWISSSS